MRFVRGAYDAADSIVSNRLVESFEQNHFTVGSPVLALRNVREGQGTITAIGSAIQRLGHPPHHAGRCILARSWTN